MAFGDMDALYEDEVIKPYFRPAINLGCMMDIPTGEWSLGANNESLLDGGLGPFTGIGAFPNNFKSALLVYFILQATKAYPNCLILVLDTEGTLKSSRFYNYSKLDPILSKIDFDNEKRIIITDISAYNGDGFWEMLKKKVSVKSNPKLRANFEGTTYFLDNLGVQRKALYPTLVGIDSLTKMPFTNTQEQADKNAVGSSGMNTSDLGGSRAKAQMLNQVPQLMARHGVYVLMTALQGHKIEMDARPTDKRLLTGLKPGTEFKNVSNAFYSLPNNMWNIIANQPLVNKDKMQEYPSSDVINFKGDTDLARITVKNLRAKNGISGLPISYIVSQSQGILPALSEFDFCKQEDRFGMGGNLINYYMELRPEVKLSRTVVRDKLAKDHRLAKAVQFTADILQ